MSPLGPSNPPAPRGDTRADALLVALAGRGDADAFATLYKRHREFVLRVATRFSPDHDTALDVTQEVFAYLVRKLPTLTLTAKLTTYLYPAIKNIALTQHRKTRGPLKFAALGIEEPPQPESTPAPRTLGAMECAVNDLPEHQREVILLRFVDDLSMAEIGLALGIPDGTVKSRLHLAIKTLRADPRTAALFSDAEQSPPPTPKTTSNPTPKPNPDPKPHS